MTTKVMVVDDDEDIIYVVKSVLGREGFEVYGALGGKECIDSFEEANPDILLMDIMMPDMSGWEVIRELKETGALKNVKVIMLTVVKEPEEEHSDLSPHIMDYLRKPVRRDVLLKRVSKLSDL